LAWSLAGRDCFTTKEFDNGDRELDEAPGEQFPGAFLSEKAFDTNQAIRIPPESGCYSGVSGPNA
jgi:hypothetical protein